MSSENTNEDKTITIDANDFSAGGQDTELEKEDALSTLNGLIHLAFKGRVSDVILRSDQVPMFSLNGELVTLKEGVLISSEIMSSITKFILTPKNLNRLKQLEEVDVAYTTSKNIRARINVFYQMGKIAMVLRIIAQEVPNLSVLGMPKIFEELLSLKRGLILVTGATGSGKSTTLAAFVDYVNRMRNAHIITIEDPIEYVHINKKSCVTQRELDSDTRSYSQALRSSLRQAPHVILVGELRDGETIEVALQAADTGHLVLSTMHTNDASDAINRILASVDKDRESIVRSQLSENIRAVISQRLVKRKGGKGMACAQEIMVATGSIREQILTGQNFGVVREYIAQGENYGMQTFDQHLFRLYQDGHVEYAEAYANATNKDNFKLLSQGISSKEL